MSKTKNFYHEQICEGVGTRDIDEQLLDARVLLEELREMREEMEEEEEK